MVRDRGTPVIWLGVILILFGCSSIVGISLLGSKLSDLKTERASLQQQLEQAKTEAKDNIGKPINVHNLPDGEYRRSENGHYGFVQINMDFQVGPKGPHIAVWDVEDIPERFRVKNGAVQAWEIRK